MKIPKTAFILAAGFGTRMQPLTNHVPKPMVEIDGKPLLTHICDHLKLAGVEKAVINTHHLPHVIQEWSNNISGIDIQLSYEDPVLETGGGILNALDMLGDEPFYVIAGDSFWYERNGSDYLQDIARSWDGDAMDILIGLKNTDDMDVTQGVGSYMFSESELDSTFGQIERLPDCSGTHMFTNVRINHPRIFKTCSYQKGDAFSFLEMMDDAEQQNRLFGFDYQGDWHHVSTPDDLNNVQAYMGLHVHKDKQQTV